MTRNVHGWISTILCIVALVDRDTIFPQSGIKGLCFTVLNPFSLLSLLRSLKTYGDTIYFIGGSFVSRLKIYCFCAILTSMRPCAFGLHKVNSSCFLIGQWTLLRNVLHCIVLNVL